MISITIPLSKPLPNPTNLREHWGTKAARVKQQRGWVRLAMARWRGRLMDLAETCASLLVVRLTRIAPRELDDDGNVAAFKAIRDEVAELAGVDDGSPVWRWEYAQEKGKPAVRIEVEVAP